MANKYGFFDSVKGDRKYSAEDFTAFMVELITDGVLPTPAENLAVTKPSYSGMVVKVYPGWAYIGGKWYRNTTEALIAISPADKTNPRYDRIVVRLDTAGRKITLEVKTGTASENPVPPALTRIEGGVRELSLARILIIPGSSNISAGNILDERSDDSVCGYVTWKGGLPDTSELTRRMGGMSFSKLTRTKFDALAAYADNTMYFVAEDNGSITTYVGSIQTNGGASTHRAPAFEVSAESAYLIKVTKEE